MSDEERDEPLSGIPDRCPFCNVMLSKPGVIKLTIDKAAGYARLDFGQVKIAEHNRDAARFCDIWIEDSSRVISAECAWCGEPFPDFVEERLEAPKHRELSCRRFDLTFFGPEGTRKYHLDMQRGTDLKTAAMAGIGVYGKNGDTRVQVQIYHHNTTFTFPALDREKIFPTVELVEAGFKEGGGLKR